jgi:hypothetical protein
MVEKAAVYSFKKYDFNAGTESVRPVKGTLKAITDIAESQPILDTEEFVDVALLDGDGFYRPQA